MKRIYLFVFLLAALLISVSVVTASSISPREHPPICSVSHLGSDDHILRVQCYDPGEDITAVDVECKPWTKSEVKYNVVNAEIRVYRPDDIDGGQVFWSVRDKQGNETSGEFEWP